MLIVTITTAVCLKKKYSKGKEKVESLTLEEQVCILPFQQRLYIFVKSKQSNSVKSKLEYVTFFKSEDSSLRIKELY